MGSRNGVKLLILQQVFIAFLRELLEIQTKNHSDK